MHPSILLRYASEPPSMTSVRTMLKNAMRSGNSIEKNTMRAVMAAVKNADISKPGSMSTDLQFAGLLNSLIKKRVQSAEEYISGTRNDLAEGEQKEAEVLKQLVSKLDIATPEQLKTSISEFVKGLEIDSTASDAFKRAMSQLPKDIETQWKAPKSSVVSALKDFLGQQKRGYSTSSHSNPLGLRRRSQQPVQKQRIPNVKHIILVSSAKGGVGKSTVATNLAQSLFHLGHNTGLLDVDIFGPSIPTMLGLSDISEPKLNINGEKLLPIMANGLKCMSMGFLIPKSKSVSWRGLLVQKALQQLLFQVEWGPTEYLIVDMPPGTGDIQLTIGQQLEIDGAVLVSTPQQIALIDAERGLDLFNLLKIPVLGLVNNMAYFKCPCCDTNTDVFAQSENNNHHSNGLKNVPVLANIPIEPAIAKEADNGKFELRSHYIELAEKVVTATTY